MVPSAAKATEQPGRRVLTDEQLEELLSLLEEADSVELKLTVPESDQRSVLGALGIDPLDARIRQVFFFDTRDLALNRRGIVVRARRTQGRDDDSVVKVRPVVPSDLGKRTRSSPNMVIEVDAMPGGFVCSASMKGVPRTEVRRVVGDEGRVGSLFSKEQRAFYAAHASGEVALDDLVVLGPINCFRLRFKPTRFKRKLVAELWMFPNNSRILELSTKCPPRDAIQAAVETRLFLTKQGVDLSGHQEAKTSKALEYFSRKL